MVRLYRPEDASRVQETAECLFYPLWDAGLELGHGARTVDECLTVASENLELETSFCQARLLVGDQDLFRELMDRSAGAGADRRRRRVRLAASGGAGSASRSVWADGHVDRTRSEGRAGRAARRARGLLVGLCPSRGRPDSTASCRPAGFRRRFWRNSRRRPTASCARGRLCTMRSAVRSTGSTWMCRMMWPPRSARSQPRGVSSPPDGPYRS